MNEAFIWLSGLRFIDKKRVTAPIFKLTYDQKRETLFGPNIKGKV